MGWLRKFIGEVKDEWNRQESMDKNMEIIKNSVDTVSTLMANVSLGMKRYNTPTVRFLNYKQGSYGDRTYNSSQLLSVLESKNKRRPLIVNEVAVCKQMKMLLEEHMEKLGLVDEHGNWKLLFSIEDEVLRDYALHIRTDIRRLEKLIENNTK